MSGKPRGDKNRKPAVDPARKPGGDPARKPRVDPARKPAVEEARKRIREEAGPPGGRKRLRWFLGGAGVVAAIVLVIMLVKLREPPSLRYRVDLASPGFEVQTVTVYYLAADSLALAPRQREVVGGRSRRELAQDLVGYLSQSSEGLRAALPPGTELLNYFEDPGGLGVLNFNERIGMVRGAGIREERLLLSALVRTMSENMGDLKRLRLMELGRPLDIWGAHLRPGPELEVGEW